MSNLFQESSTGQPYALQQNQSDRSGQKGPLKVNLAKRAWADMNRNFRILSSRNPEVDTVAAARYKNVGSDMKFMNCSNVTSQSSLQQM